MDVFFVFYLRFSRRGGRKTKKTSRNTETNSKINFIEMSKQWGAPRAKRAAHPISWTFQFVFEISFLCNTIYKLTNGHFRAKRAAHPISWIFQSVFEISAPAIFGIFWKFLAGFFVSVQYCNSFIQKTQKMECAARVARAAGSSGHPGGLRALRAWRALFFEMFWITFWTCFSVQYNK